MFDAELIASREELVTNDSDGKPQHASPESLPINDKELWQMAAEQNFFALYKIAKKFNLEFVADNFPHDDFNELVCRFNEQTVVPSKIAKDLGIFFERELKAAGFYPAKTFDFDTELVPHGTIFEGPLPLQILSRIIHFIEVFNHELYDRYAQWFSEQETPDDKTVLAALAFIFLGLNNQ